MHRNWHTAQRGSSSPWKVPANQALIFEVELLGVTGEPVEWPKDELKVDEPLGPALPDGWPSTGPATKP